MDLNKLCLNRQNQKSCLGMLQRIVLLLLFSLNGLRIEHVDNLNILCLIIEFHLIWKSYLNAIEIKIGLNQSIMFPKHMLRLVIFAYFSTYALPTASLWNKMPKK